MSTAAVAERVVPIAGQVMLKHVEFDSGYEVLENLEQTNDPAEANAITSRIAGLTLEKLDHKLVGLPLEKLDHKLVVDVDFPVHAIPSSTPGHSHLYIDKAVSWDKLTAVLDALADAGIVERGYADASIDQGFTTVRAPWVKKAPAA